MLHVTACLPEGPTNARYYAFVAAGRNMFVFGPLAFRGNRFQMDVHVFNTVSLRWSQLPAVSEQRGELPPEVPPPCKFHSAVLVEDVVYIWGGVQGNRRTHRFCDVLYAFDVDAHRWSRPEVSGTVPKKRACHSACVLDKVMYIHGGRDRLNGYNPGRNDISKLDTSTMVWSTIEPRSTLLPPPRPECHSATIIGNKMIVLGGCYDKDL